MGLPQGDRELVQIVDAALANAALRAGARLVCRLGCTQCCHGAFTITELDALRLVAGIEVLHRENPDLAAEIERRARTWIGTYGADFPGDSDEDRERFAEFANEAACPALDPATGRCDVYEWRPMTCRVFGPPIQMDGGTDGAKALGHCELCFAGATEDEVARCEMPVPHELEEKLLDEIPEKGETLVAFALLR